MAHSCPPPMRFCSLWHQFYRKPSSGGYWDDAAHGPFAHLPPPYPRWNFTYDITPLSSETLAVAAQRSPAERCRRVGIQLRDEVASVPAHKLQWLHIPKTGTSFGTTIMHRGCPRIPATAAADDGPPILTLTSAYPRGRRRFCDKDAFLGNLNGHEPLHYPAFYRHTVAIFREPSARLRSECRAVHSEFVRAFHYSGVQHPRRRLLQRRSRRRGPSPTPSVGWREGSVYTASYLREFLFSHGFSHHAIRQLTEAWNATRSIDPYT